MPDSLCSLDQKEDHQAVWCMWRRKRSAGDFVDETWQRDHSETGREDFGDLKRIKY